MENLDKKVFIQTFQELSLSDLANTISDIVHHDDIAFFIARLDLLYESWDVTESLINHFDHIKITYLKEIKKDEQELKPKNLLSK